MSMKLGFLYGGKLKGNVDLGTDPYTGLPSTLTVPGGFFPRTVGTVFFVDGSNGDNDNDGLSQGTAFETITYALTQCTSGANDVIFCFNMWDQEPGVITVNKTDVHIFGVGLPTAPAAYLPAIGDNPVFRLLSSGNGVEIAGFTLGGGDNNPGIEINNCYTAWLHDIWFGHVGVGDTPQDGIRNDAGLHNYANLRVENCSFFGSAGEGSGTLTRYGIYFGASGINGQNAQFVNNRFFNLTYAIRIVYGLDQLVEHNYIMCPADDLVGRGIYFQVCTGAIVANNKAGDNGLADMTNNPYYDSQGAKNAWLCNQNGVTDVIPAAAL